jgi:RNase H-like domain found in reverse transcriptase
LAFRSRVLSQHERNYSIPKKELLSVVVHYEHFRDYLIGTHSHLWVDSEAIVKALSTDDHDKRDRTIMGWKAMLNEFSFSVFHLRSEANELADLASRVQRVESKAVPADVDDVLERAHSHGHFGASVMFYHITVTMERNDIPNLRARCLKYT